MTKVHTIAALASSAITVVLLAAGAVLSSQPATFVGVLGVVASAWFVSIAIISNGLDREVKSHGAGHAFDAALAHGATV